MKKVEKNPILQDDILRYKKNKFASSFALLALVFNCLYFTILYAVMNSDMYKMAIGFSIIVNLFVLLIGFYSSEGIKGYNKKFSIALIVLGAVQIIRIFYYPVTGLAKGWLNDSNFYFGITMTQAANGTLMIIYLAASAACFILSAVQGYIVAQRLENFQKKLDKGEVSVEKTLADLDASEAQTESKVAEEVKPAASESVEAGQESASTKEADNG